MFVFDDLANSRSAGGHSRDIDLSFWPLLFFGWPPVPHSLAAAVLSLIPRNLLLGAVTSGDSFSFCSEIRFSLGFVTCCT